MTRTSPRIAPRNILRTAYEICLSFDDSLRFAKTNMGARCWRGNISAVEAGIIDSDDWTRAGKTADAYDKAQVEALAADLHMSESQLSHALAGEKNTHLPLDRFEGTSPAYRAAFVEELASVFGVADLLVTARDVLAVMRSHLHQARARRTA